METLVPIIFKNANGIPVELHTHCTTGLGPLCCIKGMELGIRSINTGLAAAGRRHLEPLAV